MVLLERGDALDAMRGAFGRVRGGGRGEFVMVGGEAGVGKTSVLRRFADELAQDAVVLWGACDSLSTPRPLGLLSDIALQTAGELGELLSSGAARDQVFGAALQLLDASLITVAVIEDAHWADEATIDLLTYLRRRVDTIRAIVIVSYRDDEITSRHPLRLVLRDSSARDTRLHLAPLSLGAVTTLAAGSGADPVAVHRVTGGNAFLRDRDVGSGWGGGVAHHSRCGAGPVVATVAPGPSRARHRRCHPSSHRDVAARSGDGRRPRRGGRR